MNDFYFETNSYEAYLNTFPKGARIPAYSLLVLLEECDDEVENAFQIIDERNLILDLESIPKSKMTTEETERLQLEKSYYSSGINVFEENDPIRIFLSEIPGSIDENAEYEASAEYLRYGDGAEKMLQLALPRVVRIAGEYLGHGILLSDLLQEASLGLWKGITQFNGGEYIRLTEEAVRSVLRKAVFCQARSTGISEHIQELLKRYTKAEIDLYRTLGRGPSLEEISGEIGITPELGATIQKMQKDAQLKTQADAVLNPEKTEEPAKEDDGHVENTAYYHLRERVSDLLANLETTDAEILTYRFGLKEHVAFSTEEIAHKLGLTVEEVMEREAAALSSLRQMN